MISVGIIMDGNRRWAKEKSLPTLEGHRKGLANVKEIVKSTKGADVGTIILYAFSTENWNRSKKEVSYLIDLFALFLSKEVEEMDKENIKVVIIGQRERLSPKVQKLITEAEEKTKDNTGMTLAVGISYGGRADILQAADKGDIEKNLWTKDLQDPDLIIRTGGEKRLSGFLTWNSIYSELFFVDTFWPDFTKEEFLGILQEFKEREKRNGK